MDKMLAEGIINTIKKYFRKVAENFDYLDKNIERNAIEKWPKAI